MKPIAVTMGDPAGIGGELTLKAWRSRDSNTPVFLAIDNLERLARLSDHLELGIPLQEVGSTEEAHVVFRTALPVYPLELSSQPVFGQASAENAAATIQSIEKAVDLAHSGAVCAIVTNPINKAVLYQGAGFAYPGHTEFLAALGGVERTVMMLAAPGLRVVPVTIHIAIADIPTALSERSIIETIRITYRALQKDFGIAEPRIAVAGLNPHAGEGGAMGREEIEIITPTLNTLREEGLSIKGPLPADTMFHEAARQNYDVAICMYHDQALIPLKAHDFFGGVNVTLGLPFVRTSPDHGTAYDLAGKGVANISSFVAALKMAADSAARRGANA